MREREEREMGGRKVSEGRNLLGLFFSRRRKCCRTLLVLRQPRERERERGRYAENITSQIPAEEIEGRGGRLG